METGPVVWRRTYRYRLDPPRGKNALCCGPAGRGVTRTTLAAAGARSRHSASAWWSISVAACGLGCSVSGERGLSPLAS